ncbi:amino acid adenylation domain protein [Gloeothece citriformis PCC 7424]|uniref:Amino acid adenylation domain protein n=1 Tax=Gloeothece citriformis (strain PCC 7424) TaxID=65393 RepID=B7KFL3_GLOC7|nr:amino acid adenylation domain-containing protein [Gloeothece citriformis]ACK73338.1 amino acid adenylation domain protein [Gloeothece citriformis PCC 7424]
MIQLSNTLNYFSLSSVQQASWFLYQLNPDTLSDKLSIAFKIKIEVDIVKLEAIFHQLIHHYPSLRTCYPEKEGELKQTVLKEVDFKIEIVDASGCSSETIKTYLEKSTQRRLNLEQGQVIRGSLLKVSLDESILVITVHKIAADQESLWNLVDKFIRLYHEDSSFLDTSVQSYQDYVNLQEDYLTCQASQKAQKFWQKTVSQELPVLELPSRLSRPPVRTYKGSVQSFRLSEQLSEKIKQLAIEKNVSLETLLISAFKILLFRYTSEENITLGWQKVQNLTLKNQDQLGNYSNLVILQNLIDKNKTFTEVLNQVDQKQSEVSFYQDYPFSLLVKHLKYNPNSSYPPLCQVSFAFYSFNNYPYLSNLLEKLETNHPELDYFELPQQRCEFDLSLEVIELNQSLLLQFKYNTDVLESDIIIQLGEHLQNLLTGIVNYPREIINQLPLLSPLEKDKILFDWNKTQKDYNLSRCLHHWIEDKTQENPEAIAIIFEDKTLTYQQLNERSNKLAHYLQQQGVNSESLVGICVERSLEMVIGLLGILKAGGAYVPLDPGYPKDRLAYMLEDSQVSILLTQEKLIDQLPENKANIICLDKDWKTISNYPTNTPSSNVTSDNLAYIIYTSGSTGKPKGVMNTHRGIVNRLLWMQDQYQLTLQDRVLQKTPFSFDVSVWEFFWPLMTGSRLIIAKPEGHKDSSYLVNLIAQNEITTLHFVPSMLQVFLQEKNLDRCQSLKRVICSGEALPFSLQQRFFDHFNCELHNLYGPTEAAIDVSFYQCQRDTKLNSVPIGRPVANTQLYILDEDLQPVPVGVAGEIHIGGIQVARGYLNRPDLTKEKFICDPFNPNNSQRLYKTGDLGRYLSDGNIEYIRRLDHQVKIRGFRIELGEIENTLSQHPAIQETLVISHLSQTGDQQLIAYLVATEKILPSQLRSFLADKLPDYMIPSAFVTLEKFPLTPNGKVNRRALPQPDLTNFTDTHDFVAPRDKIEEKLTQIWSQLLNLYPIGVKDNFFELGGHSLLALNLMSKIQQEFQKNLPLVSLFTSPTIEQLAQVLRDDRQVRPYSPLVPIQPKGTKTPFYCVHPAGGHVLCYVKLARYLGDDQPFYGLQAQGFNEGEEALTSVEEMASLYVKAIREFQPEGPYQVGGWSFGGVVAYEIAQQLHRQGQKVKRLAILDSYVPILLDKQKKINDVYMIGVLSRVFGGMFGQDNLVSPEELEGLTIEEKIDYIIDKARQVGIFPPEVEQQQNRRILDVLVGTIKATYAYQRQPYPDKVTVFRATEKHIMASDPQLVWVELFAILDAPEVEIIKVPGHHYSFILDPHVRVLAECLAKCLNELSADVLR